MFAAIAFWKEEKRVQRGSETIKFLALKLPFLLTGIGTIIRDVANLSRIGDFSKKHNFYFSGNCAKVTQEVYLDIKVQPESEIGSVLRNYCKAKIQIIYLVLFIFLLSNSVLPQENVIRFAWTPNKESYLSHYVIYRDTEPGTMKMLDQIPKSDSTYQDDTVQPRVTYYYKLTAVDISGHESSPSNEISAIPGSVTLVHNNEDNFINSCDLKQNYPNPFNSTTTISYSIEKSSWIVITIYDALGREIKKVEDSYKTAGRYQVNWDGTNRQGEEVATGIYYYQLLAESFTTTKKLIMQK